jgi:hypothetical protein
MRKRLVIQACPSDSLGFHYQIYPTGKRIQSFSRSDGLYRARASCGSYMQLYFVMFCRGTSRTRFSHPGAGEFSYSLTDPWKLFLEHRIDKRVKLAAVNNLDEGLAASLVANHVKCRRVVDLDSFT